MPCKKRLFGHIRTAKAQISCASNQSDQGIHCPLAESLDTTECMNGEQRPGLDFKHAQDDLNPRMFEETFSLDVAHLDIKYIELNRT